jgi:hypothetical protein
LRIGAGLSQIEAAKLVQSTERRWRDWETGVHKMHPGLWELFNLKLSKQRESQNAKK